MTPGTLRIPYESESFPTGTPSVASGELDVTWDDARRAAEDHASELATDGYQADGLLVVAGRSWRERFQEFAGDEG